MSPLRASDWLDDWFVVDDYGCFGQPEGTCAEWKKIVSAMKLRHDCHAGRRLALRIRNGYFELFSPRNTTGPDDCAIMSVTELPQWLYEAESLLKTQLQEVDNGEGI